jgi:NitT/TauT family transport system substrate-binding protein
MKAVTCPKRSWEDHMLRVIAFTLAAVAAAVAPATASAQMPVSTEKLKIVIGYQPLTPTWGVAIVTGSQLWKPYLPNVEIERSDFMSGMPLVNNMLAGKIDIGYIGDMPAIVLGSKSDLQATRFVSVTDADEGGESVIYVKKDSPIKTVKGLEGQNVSVPFGGFTHRFAEVVEQAENIKFNIVGQSPEVGLTNLQAGKVAAYIPWEPYGKMAVARGFAEPLIDGTKYHFNSLRGVVVSKAFMDAHPDIVIGWMRAELDAHKMMRGQPDRAAKIIFEEWKKFEVPYDIIRSDFNHSLFPDEITPEWRKVLTDGGDFLLSHKLIERVPDWNTFIDDSWLKKAASIPSQMK